ncbi:hypothetical protein BDK51DRAFT_33820 [Blyttiomyces helicus]|uniref:DNA-directed RNA polymerase III subunit RPC9 n=1 Tax=Blyttiomyces helicus TaxID=388810 RepID=A0A4P9WCB1_9FUNG|nr:hypothetical protein BDK51DRAFT_33820 [Blyttiomyces helicus]|eukprot:RKO90289.1 hypothetical protein BDK51DRAFT_33820 [Blyttiomyces helicus]
MEVLELRSAVLMNIEVFLLLNEFAQDKGEMLKHESAWGNIADEFQDLNTVQHETMAYLSGTPASKITLAQAATYVRESEAYGLTKLENLIILNLRPWHQPVVEAIVEDYSIRFPPPEETAKNSTPNGTVHLRPLRKVILDYLPYEDPDKEYADDDDDEDEEDRGEEGNGMEVDG